MKEKIVRLPCDVVFKKGTRLSRAPVKTERFGVHYEAVLGIGKDNVAYFTLSGDDLAVLEKKKK